MVMLLLVPFGGLLGDTDSIGPMYLDDTETIDVDMTIQEIQKLQHLYPEEVKVANITFKHMGLTEDEFWVNLTVDHRGLEDRGWAVHLDTDELALGANETVKGHLIAQGPEMCEPGDHITVNITITSKTNTSKTDSLVFDLISNCPSEGIDCACADNVHLTGAGEVTEFMMAVRNMDYFPRDIVMSVVDAPYDWDYKFNMDEFSLEANKAKYVSIMITLPEDAMADEIGTFIVKAAVIGNENISDQCFIHLLVWPEMSFTLENLGEDVTYVEPGNSVDFDLRLHNDGNLGNIVFIVEIESPTGDWCVYLDRTSWMIPPWEYRDVTLTAIAPIEAPAGTSLSVRLIAYNDAETVWDRIYLKVIVGQVQDLDIDVDVQDVSVAPGDTASFDMSITNNGNGPEELYVSFDDVPEMWGHDVDRGSGDLQTIYLKRGQSIDLLAKVTVPVDELAGTFTMFLNVSNRQGDTVLIPLNVEVEQLFLIDIHSEETHSSSISGNYVMFDLTVTNLGNGPDTVFFDVSEDLPKDWVLWVVHGADTVHKLDLGPRASVDVVLEVYVPLNPEQNRVEFDLMAWTLDDVNDTVSFMIDVELPDLEVLSISYGPEELRPHDAAEVLIVVANTGLGDASHVPVYIYIDGGYKATFMVDQLPAGSRMTLLYGMVPNEGRDYTVSVMMDPEDGIHEVDEGNNALSSVVKVSSREHTEDAPGFEGALLVMAVMASVALVLMIRNER
jgi:uncharacterized membrane protein